MMMMIMMMMMMNTSKNRIKITRRNNKPKLQLGLPTLVYRRARRDNDREVFKIVHGYYDPDGVPYLKPSSYTSTRGNDKQLVKL